MQKMGLLSPALFLCADVCAVRMVGVAQLSALLLPHPYLTLWGGGLLRAGLYLLLLTTYPAGTVPWMTSSEGLHSMGVLFSLYPAYVTLLWACGQPTVDQLWAWHSWQGLLQSYSVGVVSWLYWTRSVPLLSSRRSGQPDGQGGASLTRLTGFMKPFLVQFSAVLLLVVISSLGEMAIPHYTGKMTDWIMNEDEPEAFSRAITVMSIITIASALCEFVCDLIYNITMSLIHTSVQRLVFQSVLKQEIAFFDSTQTGVIVSRITTDTNTTSESLSEKLSLLMWYFARVVFLLGFMVGCSWRLSLFTVMGLPVILVIPKISGKFHQTLARNVQTSLAKANHIATETFSSMKTVRSFANEEGETERYRRSLEDTFALNRQEAAAYAASQWTNSMSSLLLKVSILYYGGSLVSGGDISSGHLVSFVLYELQFSSAVEALMSCYPAVKKAVGSSEEIFEFLDRQPQVPPDGDLAPLTLTGHVQFHNVTFTYPNQSTPTLRGVSLDLRPGQVTALVGLSGAGKSSCVSLLERFYQPQEGVILLDGEPLTSYQDQYLHDKIRVVSQQPELFARSIRENIKYGCEDASDQDMYRAARLANAHNFITELPNGYDTDIGEKGGLVSGGQKQRIAIARALVRPPRVLVLDDATSNLDAENQHLVHQALLNQTDPCTVLLIAQKMSWVRRADHIVVLREGVVLEQGSHAQLMETGGFYAELVRKQDSGFQRRQEEGQAPCDE